MSTFKCTITDCPLFGQEIEVSRVSWKFSNGKMVHGIKCAVCKSELEYKEEPYTAKPESVIAKYGSWTKLQKEEYRKKHNIND